MPVKLSRKIVSLAFLIGLMAVPLSQAQESLLLAPGDLVHIVVFDVPEMEQHVRITDDGEIHLALIGQVAVAGMAPSKAAQKVADLLTGGSFIQHAQVSILVEQYAAADISVSGQVQRPGSYPVTTPRNIMDVLSMAAGLTPIADIHLTVKRRGGLGETVYVTVPNNADAALTNAVMVYPGDLVIVPKAGLVYVLGDAARPGGYVMNDDAHLTVLQAIALAGGTTKTAAEGRVCLVRQGMSGPQETQLHLKEMERGTQADLLLKAEDVIYIPYSTAKNIMLGASAILSSAGGAAIYAAH
jgi:polysaccharide export outer membrane protein